MDPYSADRAKRKERKFFHSISLDPNIKIVAICSLEGLPISSILPQGADETNMVTMVAACFSLAERSIIEMRKGEFEVLFMKGTKGYLITIPIFDHDISFLLMLSTSRDIDLRLISLENLRRIGREVVLSLFKG
ncbi:MAG: roadblock/LC7 domain-containing protein [Candidatus Thorarchaeota archaeon]